ncbi:MAG: DMT family transporter [Prevotella sp.]|nr:DMT family transporter [Prevotella sp.]
MTNDTQTSTPTRSIFQRPVWVAVFAITAAMVWGWAYPLIKLGFREFGITPDMTGSKMLFAGIRFCLSGLIILAVAKAIHRPFALGKTSDSWYVLLFSLLNTTLHYAFFYFGLSHSEGARAAILNSMSVFTVVVLACMFFKSDRMTTRKITGCVIGILGVLALNLGGKESGHFTWLGDGMIILNALCSAFASLMTRGLGKRVDVFVGTGYSLAAGGALLIIPGLATGSTLPHVSLWGIVILALLIAISTIGFTLYNKLLTCNPVGKVAIYNSLIPVIGAVSSCLCLGETFYWKYAIAGALATTGIYIINKGK